MHYTLVDLLKSEHIMMAVQAADAKAAIELLTAALVESGYAEPEFSVDVWKRELAFPTGLPTQPVAIAIPHADPDHVNNSAVCIGVLATPVEFGQMGTDGSIKLLVNIVFLLAIKEREKQVAMIQQLITLIQSPALLAGLISAKDKNQVLDLIQQTLNEEHK